MDRVLQGRDHGQNNRRNSLHLQHRSQGGGGRQESASTAVDSIPRSVAEETNNTTQMKKLISMLKKQLRTSHRTSSDHEYRLKQIRQTYGGRDSTHLSPTVSLPTSVSNNGFRSITFRVQLVSFSFPRVRRVANRATKVSTRNICRGG